MYPLNILFCYVLLLVSSSESRRNSTNNNEQRDNLQYEFRINSTNNDRMDSVRYESHGHIMKVQDENNHTFTKSRANSTKVNIMDNSTLQEFHNSLTKAVGESDFTSYQSYGNFDIDDYNDTIIIISHDACVNRTCIQLCFCAL
ncbi:PREDICTED: uncharacterized protein LOC105456323 [Wasmannia auropunctata]|uniref:uncharacterized protein LOC105456323 n=1 Tax=Wasmannia auropunctata TaxID=64793 RepID=UPI0005EF7DB3|nr:PREDICTED: uncharacterized protein LOC105456323 [Wasmannia auropunctata]